MAWKGREETARELTECGLAEEPGGWGKEVVGWGGGNEVLVEASEPLSPILFLLAFLSPHP